MSSRREREESRVKAEGVKFTPLFSLNIQRLEKGDRENGGSLGCGRKLVRQWNGLACNICYTIRVVDNN